MTKNTEVAELRARLEAAEKRAEEGPCHHQNTAYLRMMAQRNQLAAVVEKVRAAVHYGSRMDAHPTRLPTDSVQDSELWWAAWHARADEAWRRNLTEALATTPADALRELKAEAWDEGVNAEAKAAVTASPRIENPYRREAQS